MRFRKALLKLKVLASLLWALPVVGAELSDEQLRSGLTQLASLLAADVPKDARWVLVESQGRRFGIFAQEEDVFRTEGNAFLFDEKPGSEARVLILYAGSVFTVYAEREGGGPVREPQEMQEQRFSATWKKADVAKDVAAAAEWLKKEASRVKPGTAATQMNGRGFDDDGSANQLLLHQQTALLWASVLLHTGHEPEALSLAHAAMTNADESRRKQLLDGCFDRRANKAFQQVMKDFNGQHDWSKLRDALAKLVSQYPLGWQLRDAVRVLLHNVTERAKLPAAPPLKTLRALSDADQKVLLAWLKELEDGKQIEYSRWSLPETAGEDGEERRFNQGAHAAFPRSHGLAAIPLLTALLGDDTLTLVDLNQGQGMEFGSYGYYGGGDEDAVTKLQRAYERLPKPKTRAELAWMLLVRVLPRDLLNSNSENHKEMAGEILSWYTSLKDAPPAELALAYLEAGENDQNILKLALEVTDPKKLARLENSMLEQAQIYDLSNLVPFVEKLGPEKAPAFVKKVRQKLEGELSRYGSADDQSQQRKQMESNLRRLETAASGQKKKPEIKEVLAVLAAYDPAESTEDQMEVREAYEEFSKLMQKRSASERLELIFAALPDFKSAALAVNLLQFALRADQAEGGGKLSPEQRQALLERTRPQWQKLLDASAKDAAESNDEPERLLILTVSALENMVTGEDQRGELSQLSLLGSRGAAILRQRAATLLAGQKAEPLPSAAAIKADERQKLLDQWSKKSAEEISRGLETLPVDQLLALNETLARASDLPGSFKEYAGLIQTVQIKAVADAAPWQAFRGKAWSKDTLVALARQVSSYGGGRLVVQLQRGAPLFGFNLQVSEVPKFKGLWQAQQLERTAENLGGKLPKLGNRLSAASFQQARANAQWLWLDSPKVEAVKETPKAGDDDDEAAESLQEMREEEQTAWKALTQAVENPKAVPTQIIFIGAPTTALVKKDKD